MLYSYDFNIITDFTKYCRSYLYYMGLIQGIKRGYKNGLHTKVVCITRGIEGTLTLFEEIVCLS